MPRSPSPETQLRTLKAAEKSLRMELSRTRDDCQSYRIRATRAEQACAQWQARFDALLFHGYKSQETPDENR